MKFFILSLAFLDVLGFSIIAFLAVMIVFGLPYFFIKRVRLSFRVAEELQERVAQQLSRDEREIKGHNAVLETRRRLLCFKKSMILWPKEYKVIFFITVAFVLFQAAISTAVQLEWNSDMTSFIMMFICIIWGAVISTPLIWGLVIIITGKLKKTIQQLEEAIAKQDEAVSLQNTSGGKNDQ
ncbi:Uncharacterised protein [Candidatus Bartonella washoeensis]|uniref:Uncharacterized protein n=2 Tax=Candidatus Bartonella washoeensis TaxID=186739 RepID=J0Z7N7_9HYPH|nr:hypothetical protein [Bartonella washoeensis]EJF80007.1 hypothetical protein MCQ_00550 [Bartonella washoeensis Sb944nv]EJF83718.1 hypothetical protein MCW_01267 [Bartonella washoeensis 085-0475]SPU26096.1 Uncharacterised protein [Bartonella washoeensis]